MDGMAVIVRGYIHIKSSPMNMFTIANMEKQSMMNLIAGLNEGDIISIKKLGQFQITGFDIRNSVNGIFDFRDVYIEVEEVVFDGMEAVRNRLQEFIDNSKAKGETEIWLADGTYIQI